MSVLNESIISELNSSLHDSAALDEAHSARICLGPHYRSRRLRANAAPRVVVVFCCHSRNC